jgi:FAD/FMN-containing dehydrogenases
MNHSLERHKEKIEHLQKQMKDLLIRKKLENNPSTICLKYGSSSSFTIRTKSYKQKCYTLDCGPLNDVILIDREKRTALVEPRVTMEDLIKATRPYGLTVAVVPEFRGMTVGGAIIGMAGESASHRYGCFNDQCVAYEVLLGDGTLRRVTPTDGQDIFYGIAGSYGSLGPIVSAEIRLIPAQDYVRLRYTTFKDPLEAVEVLRLLSRAADRPEFLDGIVFSKDLAVVIEGNFESKDVADRNVPKYTMRPVYAQYYYQHVEEIAQKSHSKTYEELMLHDEYVFRYDRCAFWVGSYLYQPSFSTRFIWEGVLKLSKPRLDLFDEGVIAKIKSRRNQNAFLRTLFYPFMSSKYLNRLLHRVGTQKWIQNRLIIQDFCIPEDNASHFLADVVKDPAVFPIWLLPIKSTSHPQIFAPHFHRQANQESCFINIGLYGVPSYSAPIEQITKKLEMKTLRCGGRKVLYSRSYYTPDEFWEIYPYEAYEALRGATHSKGVFQEITEKVLSI